MWGVHPPVRPGSALALHLDRYPIKDRSLVNIALYGTGRAAGALAIALTSAGHTVVALDGRSPAAVEALADLIDLGEGEPDLRIIAVSDDAIEQVATKLAATGPQIDTVHVSGAVSIDALEALSSATVQVGSFHPLQTLPDARSGAERLPGAWIGITADEPLRQRLIDLATSIGCHTFDVDDAAKPLYHAAAAATANFTLAVLDLAKGLFEAAGIPFDTARPLLEATVANAFELGPRGALTGPIARGDVDTVTRQVAAVRHALGERSGDFESLAALTARMAGTDDRFTEALG